MSRVASPAAVGICSDGIAGGVPKRAVAGTDRVLARTGAGNGDSSCVFSGRRAAHAGRRVHPTRSLLQTAPDVVPTAAVCGLQS
jgi:hypothetical protein